MESLCISREARGEALRHTRHRLGIGYSEMEVQRVTRCRIQIGGQHSNRQTATESGSTLLRLTDLKYCSREEKNSFDYGSRDDVSVAVTVGLSVKR